MKPFPQDLVGTWVHAAPWDSDDYLAEYTIALRRGRPVVSAVDLSDGERFRISEVSWDGAWLRFKSKMPSTGRIGFNEFRPKKGGSLQARFTFTVVEEMQRVTQQAAAGDARNARA
jgi:hypothetical protein